MEMVVEVGELIWQVVGVGHDVKMVLAEPFLHRHHVAAQAVLPR